MKTLYTAHATATKGRDGHVETDDKRLSLDLSPPGGSGTGTNPEQLFACGYSACFGSAIQAVAKSQKQDIGDVTIHMDVGLNQDDNNGYFINAALNVSIPKLDNAAALALVEKAHQVCPYSKATRGNIDVKLTANGQAVAAKAA